MSRDVDELRSAIFVRDQLLVHGEVLEATVPAGERWRLVYALLFNPRASVSLMSAGLNVGQGSDDFTWVNAVNVGFKAGVSSSNAVVLQPGSRLYVFFLGGTHCNVFVYGLRFPL